MPYEKTKCPMSTAPVSPESSFARRSLSVCLPVFPTATFERNDLLTSCLV